MRYVQRTLLLSTLVCFIPFVGHALREIYKNRVDPCRYYNIASLFHARYKKSIEKAHNISSKLHRFNTLQVLRDWRHVRDIFS